MTMISVYTIPYQNATQKLNILKTYRKLKVLSYLHKNILMYSSLPLIRALPAKAIPLITPLPPKDISLIRPLPPKVIPLIRQEG
jgi:hypothetical protein